MDFSCSMHLKNGTSLQNGRYRIESVLGQGGFGITYLAVQSVLNRKVAIKEFFMKDLCNRDVDTFQVSVPSVGSKELVEKFKNKFIKEAQTIAGLNNPHVIRIYDVFEENGTAYYVMEYHGGGSLADFVKTGDSLPERQALHYIRQIADALQYIHERKMNHLDVKPGNVLLDDDGNAVLIDFGLAKRYDAEGNQTSTTPVGISHGYAPFEQYKKGGVGTFSPATDIYSLGATLYRFITGKTPPEADVVGEEGLPPFPKHISSSTAEAITQSMQLLRKDRPQTVADFLALLDAPSVDAPEITVIDKPTAHEDDTEKNGKTDNNGSAPKIADSKPVIVEPEKKKNKLWLWILIALLGIGVGLSALFMGGETEESSPVVVSDSDSVQVAVQEEAPVQSEAGLLAEEQSESLRLAEERRQAEEAELARQEEQRKTEEEAERRRQEVAEEERKRQEESVPRTVTAVDLGLSVKWADRNVGSDSPEDYGSYFAWGETQPKSTYDWSTYKWCNGSRDSMTKYCTKSDYGYNGFTDGKTTLDLSDDAAYVNMGSNWRMPSKAEFDELINSCTWTWTTRNGKKGYKVTGPSGNSIFLPAAGCRLDSSLYDAGSYGVYWSSSLNADGSYDVRYLDFYSGRRGMYYSNRYFGRTVRAVAR